MLMLLGSPGQTHPAAKAGSEGDASSFEWQREIKRALLPSPASSDRNANSRQITAFLRYPKCCKSVAAIFQNSPTSPMPNSNVPESSSSSESVAEPAESFVDLLSQ